MYCQFIGPCAPVYSVLLHSTQFWIINLYMLPPEIRRSDRSAAHTNGGQGCDDDV